MLNLDLLQQAIDQLEQLIARIPPAQASLRTPCPEWNVRQLVNHVVFDMHVFVAGIDGSERPAPNVDLIDDDWLAAYRRAGASLADAWRKRGTEGTLKTSIGEFPLTWALGQHVSDLAVHAWDAARATSQPIGELNDAVGREALDWMRENLKPQFRGQAFGPEVPVPETAPLYDRLAGFSGRRVG